MTQIELHDEIVEWMDSLGNVEWARVAVVVDRLAVLGPSARMPLSRSLGDGLFELRFTLGPTARRITYRSLETTGSSCSRHSANSATTNAPRSTAPARQRRTAPSNIREGN